MSKDILNLEVLSTRNGFNSAVRHIKKTIGIAETVEGQNLGDVLFEAGDGELSGQRAGVLLRMLIVDKLGYKTVSTNLASVASNFSDLAGEFEKWKALDLIVAYHHPDMGLLVANPKIAEELAAFGVLRKRELLVIYAGKGGSPTDEQCHQAALLAVSLFEGKKPRIPPELYKGTFTVRKLKKTDEKSTGKDSPAKAPSKRGGKRSGTGSREKAIAASSPAGEAARAAVPPATSVPLPGSKGAVRMTPMYSVVVQNELFHNGNVEAWKRIVASYNAKYPELQVYIYYEGERILDINSLFKWGKVKHGSAIQFAVTGSDIKDVAKLQRYLIQGASNQFEAFLRGSVSNVLKLF
ncbi:MAG: hypothetical protein LBD78_08980 [Spirochaetaceae bacterium]|jgi:hypothetical protein|nr:hypothetical protein [Spirochaetaceae bacterium]